jgi:TetR/AcrR family transcriptional regulator, cholesterol catabolism regulator
MKKKPTSELVKTKIEKRKAEITDKAIDMFFEKGYVATSLKDIAIASGASKAGIYHYFKTKEDILAYIFIRYETENFAAFQTLQNEMPDPNLEPVEALKFIIRTYSYLSLRHERIALLSLRERHQLTRSNRKNHFREERKIFNILKNGLLSIRGIQKSYDVNALVFQIISMSVWIGYWQKNIGSLSREEIVEQNIDVICHGVFT